MSEQKIISRAEDVCSCSRTSLFAQMEKKDLGSARRMQAQFVRLEELCGKYRAEEQAGKWEPVTETGLRNTMNKMGDMVADFVFEQEDSDTADMAGLFARLGYADGNEELSGRQLKCLREFGRGGTIEQMFASAGEMSDDAIPVIEAFRHLQDEFSLREGGDMDEYSRNGLIDRNHLKKVKKSCSLYLDTPGIENSREQEAVRMVFELSEKAESLAAEPEAGRTRTDFAGIVREEERDRKLRMSERERAEKHARDLHIREQREPRPLMMPERDRRSRSL